MADGGKLYGEGANSLVWWIVIIENIFLAIHDEVFIRWQEAMLFR